MTGTNGVTSPNLSNKVAVADSFIVNRNGSTALMEFAALAAQLSTDGALAETIAALQTQILSFGQVAWQREIARMAAGETVNLAIFGDSTTDGNATTGWTANPVDGNGRPNGSANHAATAPNAWPAKLQALLRLMFNNNNINVWNAGYSGRRIADGWALANIDRAVFEHPAYGIPHILLLGFGLNDQPSYTADQLETELVKLIVHAVPYGPAIGVLSCDPAPIFTGNRNNRDTSRRIDSVKRSVCRRLNVEFFEMAEAITGWMENNGEGYRWAAEQTDYLHGGDNWHAFKATYIASRFYPDLVRVASGDAAKISPWSPRAGSGQSSEYFLPNAGGNSQFGGNWYYNAAVAYAGLRTIDTWIWNENTDAVAFYRGIDGETVLSFANGLTNGSALRLYSPIPGSTEVVRPANMGWVRRTAGWRFMDLPALIGKLPYGLSRITYEVGAAQATGVSDGYVGWLQVCPRKTRSDALKDVGRFGVAYTAGSGNVVNYVPEHPKGANLFGARNTDRVTLRATVTLPIGTGIIVGHTPSYGAIGGNQPSDRTFWFLYRQAATSIRLHNGKVESGVVSFAANIGAGTVADQADYDLRIEIERSGDNQRLRVYSGFGSTAAIMDLTIPYTDTSAVLFGGAAGGLFANLTAVSGTVFPEIKMLVIE